jgi:protein SOK2
VISDTRTNASNGGAATESYSSAALSSTYASSHVNGTTASGKRMREEDESDQQSRPASRGDDIDSLKRRKVGREGSVSGPATGNSFDREGRPVNRVKNPIPQRTRR